MDGRFFETQVHARLEHYIGCVKYLEVSNTCINLLQLCAWPCSPTNLASRHRFQRGLARLMPPLFELYSGYSLFLCVAALCEKGGRSLSESQGLRWQSRQMAFSSPLQTFCIRTGKDGNTTSMFYAPQLPTLVVASS